MIIARYAALLMSVTVASYYIGQSLTRSVISWL